MTELLIAVALICGLLGWIFWLRHRRRKAIAEAANEKMRKIIQWIGRDF